MEATSSSKSKNAFSSFSLNYSYHVTSILKTNALNISLVKKEGRNGGRKGGREGKRKGGSEKRRKEKIVLPLSSNSKLIFLIFYLLIQLFNWW